MLAPRHIQQRDLVRKAAHVQGEAAGQGTSQGGVVKPEHATRSWICFLHSRRPFKASETLPGAFRMAGCATGPAAHPTASTGRTHERAGPTNAERTLLRGGGYPHS